MHLQQHLKWQLKAYGLTPAGGLEHLEQVKVE
jgi:hypothetical protein